MALWFENGNPVSDDKSSPYYRGTAANTTTAGNPVNTTTTKSTSSSSGSSKTSSTIPQTSAQTSVQSTIDQMKANSAAWGTADPVTQQKLAAENQSLGAQIGAKYDAASGTWDYSGILSNPYGNYDLELQNQDKQLEIYDQLLGKYDTYNAEALAAKQAALEAAKNQGMASLEAQKGTVAQNATDYATAAYDDYLKKRNPHGLESEMAAELSGSGMDDYRDTAYYNAYLSAHAKNEANKEKLLNDIALGQENLKYSTDVESANAVLEAAIRALENNKYNYEALSGIFNTSTNNLQNLRQKYYEDEVYRQEQAKLDERYEREFAYMIQKDETELAQWLMEMEKAKDMASAKALAKQLKSQASSGSPYDWMNA